jgi:hypothetical protein
MKVGGPPLRSKRRRKGGEVGADQQWIDKLFIQQAAADVLELSFDVGMIYKQLLHWDKELGTPRKPK